MAFHNTSTPRPTARIWRLAPIALAVLFVAGCADAPQFKINQVEQLKFQYQQASRNKPIPADQSQTLADVLTAMFGTPDEPYFPYVLGEDDPARELVRLDYLQQSAGAVSSDRRGTAKGLYREHCAHCHGVTGDGAGSTAGFLNPYPRDFRLGKFKYKSTKLGQPPTDDDLHRVIVDGIPGTAMPSFRTLPDEEVSALIDYVKYLTIRGQTEHRLIEEMANLKEGESLIDLDWRAQQPADLPDDAESADAINNYEDALALIIEDVFLDVLDPWFRRKPTPVPEIPDSLQPAHHQFADRVAQGRDLFAGKANCAQCHGATGLGDGQTENLDDWSSQWVKGANVDPRDPQSIAPFLEAGAFPPRTIRPRNLRLRVYRGGDRYSDLYLRIANGIEGTGMPDSSALSEEEIWSLVAYVLHLPYETSDASAASREINPVTAPKSNPGPVAGAVR